MTTVINFNFLNFFRSEQSVTSTSSVRFNINSFHSNTGRREQPDDDVIDITPSRVRRAAEGFRVENPPTPVHSYSSYDRAGRKAACYGVKGRYVDTYA
jgi:hypothetical protein